MTHDNADLNRTGWRYRNLHNGRTITIISSEMTDGGNMLHKCRDETSDKTDYTGDYALENNWEEVEVNKGGRYIPANVADMVSESNITDAKFAVEHFGDTHLIEHIALLLAQTEYDACDTHSQSSYTDGGEEET